MKQKVVIKVLMNDSRLRSKAMKTAVSVPGVTSAELQGADKNQLVLTGEGIDSTHLTMLIRKKVGYAELVSVTQIPEKKEDKKQEKNETKSQPIIWTPYQYGTPHVYTYQVRETNHDPCTIM